MYITIATYGGLDWHDSSTVHEQLQYNGSYRISEDMIFEAIAENVANNFPYEKQVKEKVLRALTEQSQFRFMIKEKEMDQYGMTQYRSCASYSFENEVHYENEAVFDGKKKTIRQDYTRGQVSYTTTYFMEEIPDENLGYIVTEDFLAPTKGVPVVERMYHDIFQDLNAAQKYAKELKLHQDPYTKSIATFLVCNRETIIKTEWYRLQKEIMDLMKEAGQTHLDESFRIFAEQHKKQLKKMIGENDV